MKVWDGLVGSMALPILTMVAAEDVPSSLLLRGSFLSLTNDGAEADSSCNNAQSRPSCSSAVDEGTNEKCVWCDSAAVPGGCYSRGQSKSLPSAVFKCDTSSSAFLGRFNFKEGVTYSITGDDVDPEFCDASSKSLAGYMSVEGSSFDKKGEDKHLFYWFFEKRGGGQEDGDEEIPLIVWLTGGPGCSSSLALLTENGPCSVNPDGKSTATNPYSWTEAAHVLWLDQPAGVGFSYGSPTDSNEEMVSEDAFYFLQAFLKSYPQYQSSPLFIVGESYGGHYAPAIAHRVFTANKTTKSQGDEDLLKINLSGVAVGNGLTDPTEQYKWYPEMAYHNSHNLQVIPKVTYEAMKAVVPKCVALIEQCNKGSNAFDDFACQSAFTVCNIGLTSPYQATGLNPYDIRKKCEHPPLCYDFSNVDKFMNSKSTRSALHVSDKAARRWSSCNMGINFKFHVDWMKDFSPYIADMLEGNIPILIYAGDVDFICNYLGNQAWTLGLDWSGKEDFNAAEPHDWNDGKGLARTSKGFTFLQVYDAGHMVPSDQPKAALDMIQAFTSGKEF